MFQQFYNRNEELKIFERFYKAKGPQLAIVYGRRRVGKTELIKEFIKDKEHIYFLCDDRRDIFNIAELKKTMSTFLKDSLFEKASITNWYGLFEEFIKRNKSKRLIIVIDEFPYLIKANKSVMSIFQKIWDEFLSKTNIFTILCGSSISMMEKDVLGYKSPLYGRRTCQLKLQPLRISYLKKFFPGYNFEDIIKTYSILDSIPLYLLKFDKKERIETNLINHIFRKGEFLYEEAEILLKEELREPGNYFMILKAISFGNSKFGEIANYTGLDKTMTSKYLDNLIKLHILEKRYPCTKRKEKSKDALYYFKDNYFKFWFKFVYPNRSLIEEDRSKELVKNIKNELNTLFSFVFEDVCMKFLQHLDSFKFNKIGSWWHKKNEIDIVALNEKDKKILFAECKWKDKINPKKTLEELKEKAKLVEWNNDKRKEYFAIFAKSFKKKKKGERNVFLFDLKDLEANL